MSGASNLVIGPLLRYVDEHQATVWVETATPAHVTVTVGEQVHESATWSVHGHHYALVVVDELQPATVNEYHVALDGVTVWPEADSPYPPSVIRTPDPDAAFRLAFGSCRRAEPLDEEHLDALGADALVALAERMTDQAHEEWPNALMMLGDQVYADEPSAAIAERLQDEHGSVDGEIDGEIRDFEEYTWLYREAWTPPAVRWLLSTVPVGMLLDDHDLRDDWNTSKSWRDWITQQPWWPARVIGAYGSYWVYQHLGNLAPDELAADPLYEAMRTLSDDATRTERLDEFAWQADVEVSSARFSFRRDLGSRGRGVRLVAIDSRCSRHLDPDDRRMLDQREWAWVRNAVLGTDGTDVDHLVLCSTLPILMLPGVHHMEGWNEAIAQGAWGRVGKRFGEWFRQFLDLEHWAAFRESFAEMTGLLGDVVGQGNPPATVLMLGGDVHCSYTARAELTAVDQGDVEMHQLTMSPFRNDIEKPAKWGNRLLNRRRWAGAMHRIARRARVEDVAMDWQLEHGPWFDNGVMILTFEARSAHLDVWHARVEDGRQVLDSTLSYQLNSPPVAPPEEHTAAAAD